MKKLSRRRGRLLTKGQFIVSVVGAGNSRTTEVCDTRRIFWCVGKHFYVSCRELTSAASLTSSWDDLSLSDEPMVTDSKRPKSFNEPLHIFTSPMIYSSSPSPTRLAKVCWRECSESVDPGIAQMNSWLIFWPSFWISSHWISPTNHQNTVTACVCRQVHCRCPFVAMFFSIIATTCEKQHVDSKSQPKSNTENVRQVNSTFHARSCWVLRESTVVEMLQKIASFRILDKGFMLLGGPCIRWLFFFFFFLHFRRSLSPITMRPSPLSGIKRKGNCWVISWKVDVLDTAANSVHIFFNNTFYKSL